MGGELTLCWTLGGLCQTAGEGFPSVDEVVEVSSLITFNHRLHHCLQSDGNCLLPSAAVWLSFAESCQLKTHPDNVIVVLGTLVSVIKSLFCYYLSNTPRDVTVA